MKTLKKLLALTLAIAMVMSLGVMQAYAAQVPSGETKKTSDFTDETITVPSGSSLYVDNNYSKSIFVNIGGTVYINNGCSATVGGVYVSGLTPAADTHNAGTAKVYRNESNDLEFSGTFNQIGKSNGATLATVGYAKDKLFIQDIINGNGILEMQLSTGSALYLGTGVDTGDSLRITGGTGTAYVHGNGKLYVSGGSPTIILDGAGTTIQSTTTGTALKAGNYSPYVQGKFGSIDTSYHPSENTTYYGSVNQSSVLSVAGGDANIYTNGFDLSVDGGYITVVGQQVNRNHTVKYNNSADYYDTTNLDINGGTVYANGYFESIKLSGGDAYIGANTNVGDQYTKKSNDTTYIHSNYVEGDGEGNLHWGTIVNRAAYRYNSDFMQINAYNASSYKNFTHAQVTGSFNKVDTRKNADHDPVDMCGDATILTGENNVFVGSGSCTLTAGSDTTSSAIMHVYSGNYEGDSDNNCGDNKNSHSYTSLNTLNIYTGSKVELLGVVTNENALSNGSGFEAAYSAGHGNSAPLHSLSVVNGITGYSGELIVSDGVHADCQYVSGDKYETVEDVLNVATPTISGNFSKVTGTTVNGGSNTNIEGNENTTIVTKSNTDLSGNYNTVIVRNAADNVTVSGNAKKIIVESGIVTMTSGSALEVVIEDGGTFNLGGTAKIQNLAVDTDDYKAVTIEDGGIFKMSGGEIDLKPSSEYCNSTKLTAIENGGTAIISSGAIKITDGTQNKAICNHKNLTVGDASAVNGASTEDTLKIYMLRGIAIHNDVQSADTTIYDTEIHIAQNDLDDKGSVGINAPYGKVVINSGVAETPKDYTPAVAVTVKVDVAGDKGVALNIGETTAWQVAGSYKSSDFTAATAMKTLSAKTAATGVMPLSCGIFESLVASEDIVFEDFTTHASKDIHTLIPKQNYIVVTDTLHNDEGWVDAGENVNYLEAGKTTIVDVEWALRHAATLADGAFTMKDVDSSSASAIYLNQFNFWGAPEIEPLTVPDDAEFTLDLNGKLLTNGDKFDNWEQWLIGDYGTMSIQDSLQATGKIDFNPTGTTVSAAVFNQGKLTVTSGSIIGRKDYGLFNAKASTEIISGGTIYGLKAGIKNCGTIDSISGGVIGKLDGAISNVGIENYGNIVSISNGQVFGNTALDYTSGSSIESITGGIFTGTDKGMAVSSGAISWNFLKLADGATSGAIFSSVEIEVGKQLNDLFEQTTEKDDVLTFKDSTTSGAIEVSGIFLRAQKNIATGDATSEFECITGSVKGLQDGTKFTGPFTVIPRTNYEVYIYDATSPTAITLTVPVENNDNRVTPWRSLGDVSGSLLIVEVGKQPTVNIKVTEGALTKVVAYEDLADNGGDWVALAKYELEDYLGKYANKSKVLFVDTTPIAVDKALYISTAEKLEVSYSETSPYTSGSLKYTYVNVDNNNAAYSDAVAEQTLTTDGKIAIASGNAITMTITPDANHRIHKATIGGVTVVDSCTSAAFVTAMAITTNTAVTAMYCADTNTSPMAIISQGTASLVNGSTMTLTVTKNPADYHTVSSCAWTVDDESVVTIAAVNNSGDFNSVATVKGIKNGTTTVKAKVVFTDNTEKELTCTINVYTPSVSYGGGGGSIATYTVSAGTGVSASKASAAAGAKVTLTVASGYENPVVKDAKGNAVAVSGNTFTMPASNVTVSVSKSGSCAKDDSCTLRSFADLDVNGWYHDGIEYCVKSGLMSGLPGGLFAPNGVTSRAQVVTILYRMAGSPKVEKAASYSDVVAGKYYSDAVAWAEATGVVTGFDGKFNPDGAITREQLAAILYRYASSKGYDVKATKDITSFSDGNAVSSYAADAMKWACGAGILTGSNNSLTPAGTATRSQAAAMFMRFCENVAK